jgi:membrane associated rhomboid family serine protease
MSSPSDQSDKSRRFSFRPDSWSGAFMIMCALLGVLWVIEAFNAGSGGRLVRFGLKPREVDGLDGVLTAPFLHVSASHLLANSIPFLGLGWLVLTSGLAKWLQTSAIVMVVGGLFTWLVAPHGVIVGASGLVFGWLGYLIARAWFSRKFAWIIIAAGAAAFFSSMFTGLFPGQPHVSWQAHIGGAVGGVAAGWLLTEKKARRKPKEPKPPRIATT